jgi:hypothetical protein
MECAFRPKGQRYATLHFITRVLGLGRLRGAAEIVRVHLPEGPRAPHAIDSPTPSKPHRFPRRGKSLEHSRQSLSTSRRSHYVKGVITGAQVLAVNKYESDPKDT